MKDVKHPKMDVNKFSKSELISSKQKAEKWKKEKLDKLNNLSDTISNDEYLIKQQNINDRYNIRITLLNNALDNQKYKSWLKYLFIFFICLTSWIQPWETPVDKINKEWRNCHKQYKGKCYYVGRKFKTNSFEMYISEALHGVYTDKQCSRSRYSIDC